MERKGKALGIFGGRPSSAARAYHADMLRHTVVFRWSGQTTAADVAAVADALRRLPAAIAELRDFRVGPDLGLVDGNWDFAVVADFDDAAGWRAYTDHPAHLAVAVRIRALMADRVAVQYEI